MLDAYCKDINRLKEKQNMQIEEARRKKNKEIIDNIYTEKNADQIIKKYMVYKKNN